MSLVVEQKALERSNKRSRKRRVAHRCLLRKKSGGVGHAD